MVSASLVERSLSIISERLPIMRHSNILTSPKRGGNYSSIVGAVNRDLQKFMAGID